MRITKPFHFLSDIGLLFSVNDEKFVAFIISKKYQLFFNDRWLDSAQPSPTLVTPLISIEGKFYS